MFNIVKLKNISKTIGSGITPLRSNPRYWENGTIYWLKTEQLGEHKIYETSEKISQNTIDETSIKIFPTNTLSIAMYGEGRTRGNVSILKNEMTTNQACCNIVIDNQKADYEYVYYFLKTQYQNLRSLSSGVRKNLNSNDIKEFEIRLPNDIQIQKEITKILADLDAKIEINNRINTELEAMAKTLYDYWFVQFDFSTPSPLGRAGEGIPYKTAGGKMVWNDKLKREIPDGWEVKLYSEWINNDKSGDWGKEKIEGNYTEKVYCIRGADINGLNGTGELKSPERYILEKNLHKTLDPADLIVEISGGSPVQSTGRLAFVTDGTFARFDAPIICSNFCKAVTLKNKKLLYNFVYHWKSIYDAGVLFGYEGKTSGIKNLLFDSFVSSHYTVVPKESIASKFYDFMEPIQTKKQKNLKENQELASLRDWLLPMLMNGQVSVGDVAEELGMVAEPTEIYKK